MDIQRQKFVKRMLKQMFKIVGDKFSEDRVKEDFWYQKNTWNKKQEREFEKFFVKEYMEEFGSNKKSAQDTFSYFNLIYGWRLAKDDTSNLKKKTNRSPKTRI